MISFDDALAILADAARPLGSETVPLARAYGRTLAAPVIARVDSPPARVSTMDGYAVRECNLEARERLRIVGASYPGAGFDTPIGRGECVRIFTGAPLPDEADRVIIQERVTRDGDEAVIERPLSGDRYIRARGSDFEAGDCLLDKGRRLDARALVAAAAADLADVEVWRGPRLTVIGVGDELAPPGQARDRDGRIPDSVTLGVGALAEQWGADLLDRVRLEDDPIAMKTAAADALSRSDIVVMAGGASVGEKDFAKSVFAALGLELLFSGVSMKPGKPVWFGRAGTRLVMGLPGNPTSAMVTVRLLLAPLLAGLSGRAAARALSWRQAILAAPLPPCGDRETFVRGRWEGDHVTALSNQDSGAQRALAEAELLIRRPSGAPGAEAGETVSIIDF